MKEGKFTKLLLVGVSLFSTTFAMTSFAISESARTAADNSDDTYVLVTDTKYLLNDHEIIITGINTNTVYTALAYQQDNNRKAITLSDQTIIDGITLNQTDFDNGIQKIKIERENDLYSFYVSPTGHASDVNKSNGYLYASSSSSNELKTQSVLDSNGKFTISIGANSNHVITAQGANTRNLLRFYRNSNNPVFNCYSSDQQDVFIYKNTNDMVALLETNGGTCNVTSTNVVEGKLVRPDNPTKDGYRFAGWSLTNNINDLFDFETTVTQDVTLYAIWDEQGTSIQDLAKTKTRLGMSFYTDVVEEAQAKSIIAVPSQITPDSRFENDSTNIDAIIPEISKFVDLTYNKNSRDISYMNDDVIKLYPSSGNGTSLDLVVNDAENFKLKSIKVRFRVDTLKDENSQEAALNINGQVFLGTGEFQEVEVTSLDLITNLKIQNVYNTSAYNIIEIDKITINYTISNEIKYFFTSIKARVLLFLPRNLETLNDISEIGFRLTVNDKLIDIQVDLEENKIISGENIVYALSIKNIPIEHLSTDMNVVIYAIISQEEAILANLTFCVVDIINEYVSDSSPLDEQSKQVYYGLLAEAK